LVRNGAWQFDTIEKKHIGTESVTVKYYNTLHTIDVQEADDKLKSIYEFDK